MTRRVVIPPRPATVAAPARSILDLLEQIKSGRCSPASLSPETRRECVAYLGTEGMSVPEIAKFLKCSDRTVTRDRQVLQEAAAVERDPKLAGVMVGRLLAEAESCMQRMRRAVRDREASPGDKVDAEHRCFQVLAECARLLQSFGYLPLAKQELRSEISITSVPPPSMEELQVEIGRLAALELSESDRGQLKELEELSMRIRVAGVVDQVGRERAR